MHRTMLQVCTTEQHVEGNLSTTVGTYTLRPEPSQLLLYLQSEFRKFPLVITSSLRGECKTLQ